MSNTLSQTHVLYRIGAVSKFSGVPVPTLRIWQTRYAAFAPSTSQGQHRLYSDEDLHKAALLKALTQQGHSIGLIASLPAAQLEQLEQLGQTSSRTSSASAQSPKAAAEPAWAVVGAPLAERLRSARFQAAWLGAQPKLGPVWNDLSDAPQAPGPTTTASSTANSTQASSPTLDSAVHTGALAHSPELLVVSVNGLNERTAQQILALAQTLGARQTVVFFSFGQRQALTLLSRAQCCVEREPLNDADLASVLQRARPPLAISDWNLTAPDLPIVARQYSDAVLQRVVNIPNQVLCECPRHVAELIGQLGRFEDYSRDCESQSPQDRAIHTQLNQMAATARALFEKGLRMVATHEGISLQEDA